MASQQAWASRARGHGARSSGSRAPAQARSIVRTIHPLRPAYDRRTAIAKVLALWPRELEDESPAARQNIIARLRHALRAERRRGLAGHWTYDLARHVELLRVYREETAAVAGLPEISGLREGAAALQTARRKP